MPFWAKHNTNASGGTLLYKDKVWAQILHVSPNNGCHMDTGNKMSLGWTLATNEFAQLPKRPFSSALGSKEQKRWPRFFFFSFSPAKFNLESSSETEQWQTWSYNLKKALTFWRHHQIISYNIGWLGRTFLNNLTQMFCQSHLVLSKHIQQDHCAFS